jgi:DNA sulfur modification protein DndD
LDVEFSVDSERRLSVVRAANESGKTTLLLGLQWALYGDDALPGDSSDFRLHPLDWAGGRSVPVTVTVDFEVTRHRPGPGGMREVRSRYRVIRTASEELEEANWVRRPTEVQLFALGASGAEPLDNPEAMVADELPPELREIFFTDGDRALSFIEADVALTTKRQRVESAIRALLGLEIIESAVRHVSKATTEINKRAKALGSGGDLEGVAARLEEVEEQISKTGAEQADAKQQFATLDVQLGEIEKQISAALIKGDRETTAHELEGAKREVARLRQEAAEAEKQHSSLFRSQSLARDLLGPCLREAFSRLDELREKGKIPNTTLPVLQYHLSTGVCICGESLNIAEEGGRRRRSCIESLIEGSRKADEVQGIVTELYFSASSTLGEVGNGASWLDQYREMSAGREAIDQALQTAERREKEIEVQLDAIPNTDVRELREMRRLVSEQRDRFLQREAEAGTRIKGLERERLDVVRRRDGLLRDKDKGARILSELTAAQDIKTILERTFERLTKEELQKVSKEMNRIFLEMIGSDPDQGAAIQEAEITHEFDIVVYGHGRKVLNPDLDLNGASRRALTLAFILALTKISEIEAPNVIDTPLGMMSGYVKRSVLKTVIREGSQVILFLTHDEIAGCEDIIDQSAGVVITLTNPTHFPKMLVRDPGVHQLGVVKCQCSHKQTCRVCERRPDAPRKPALGVANG